MAIDTLLVSGGAGSSVHYLINCLSYIYKDMLYHNIIKFHVIKRPDRPSD